MQQFRKLSIFLAALAALSAAFFAASASAFPIYHYSTSFGSKGTGNGQFEEPIAAATDSAGNFWVVDGKAKNVQKFNAKGEFLLKITKGKSSFKEPSDVAVDGAGNVWVVERSEGHIVEFNSTGTYIGEFGEAGSGPGQLSAPTNIAIDSSGNFWITNQGSESVKEFGPTGTYIRSFGSEGRNFINEEEGNGKFSFMTGIATDAANNVWVVDMNGMKKEIPGFPPEITPITRIEEFSSSGVFIKQIGSQVLGHFTGHDALSISGGNLWVADSDCQCVKVLNTKGTLLSQFGGLQENEGSMVWPNGVTFDLSGNPWVVVWNTGTEHPVMGLEKWVSAGEPTPPTVATEAASSILPHQATLNAQINPNGSSTQYEFEVGITVSYGIKIPGPPAGAGAGINNRPVHVLASGLMQNTTYHYRVVATNIAGTVKGTDKTFTTLEPTSKETSEQLEGIAVINPFDESPASLSNFETKWSALGWVSEKGVDLLEGWRPSEAYPTVAGAYYNETETDTGYGIATVITMSKPVVNANRYLSLWLDMSTPSGSKNGYELRLTNTGGKTYTASLSKWVSGVKTELTSKAGVTAEEGVSLALVDRGSTVSAWLKTGAEFTSLLSATDSSFSSGKSGIEGTGNNTHDKNFKTGAL